MSWHLRAETAIEAPPSTVWVVLTDFGSYSEWNPTLRVRGEPMEGERLWALLLDRELPPAAFRPTITHLDPGRELRWRTTLPLGAVTAEHTFRVEPTPEGTRLVQTERFDGPAADPLLRRLAGAIRRTFERMNDAVKLRAERLADAESDDSGRDVD